MLCLLLIVKKTPTVGDELVDLLHVLNRASPTLLTSSFQKVLKSSIQNISAFLRRKTMRTLMNKLRNFFGGAPHLPDLSQKQAKSKKELPTLAKIKPERRKSEAAQ